jgi:hypothetical protein
VKSATTKRLPLGYPPMKGLTQSLLAVIAREDERLKQGSAK